MDTERGAADVLGESVGGVVELDGLSISRDVEVALILPPEKLRRDPPRRAGFRPLSPSKAPLWTEDNSARQIRVLERDGAGYLPPHFSTALHM